MTETSFVVIRSLEDLAQARVDALARQQAKAQESKFHIKVSMASCGIAAGAGETLQAFVRQIEEKNLQGISVTKIGCIGMCALEPIVQVQAPGQPRVTYGKVTPAVARRILMEHFLEGEIVQEYMIESEFS
ncbi:MAG: (2Fe-2S) ferredoxin domain-containing protein [Chloroflexota bacterium]